LNRREFLTGAAVLPLAAQNRRGAPPPNILLIMADDLAPYMLGCYGCKEIRTPNIDRLARGGVRFTNCFSCAPADSACRATLLTGRTPMQHGLKDFLTSRPIEDPPQGTFAPPPSFSNEIMLSDILAARGYRCGYMGRWGMGADQTPQHKFESWYTLVGGDIVYRDPSMSLNGQIVRESGYFADLVTARAARFLEEQSPDRPFFLVVAYANPHAPYEGHPPQYYRLYAETKFDTIGWQPAAPNALRDREYLKDIVGSIRQAAAATTALDDQIPPLLKKLDERGLRDNTLIIFTSENGFLLGRHGLWGKGHASNPINMFDEAVQLPMIWNWRGRTPVEAARSEVISSYDLLPSVCEAAGVAAPARNLCGRSYLTIATGGTMPKKQPWRNLVFAELRNTAMARDNRFKLVLRNNGKGPNELYSLRTDPGETSNEYDNPQFVTVRDRLAKQLADWQRKYSK
jgi:choline-sulfatase